MKIVTFNLRCVWDGDEINGFVHRMGMIWDKINQEKPDVIGFQEVVPKTLEALKCIMPDYEIVGHGRNKDYSGEGLYTAVRKTTMDLIAYETFWIGPDPYQPESRFPDQSFCPRTCVMTQLMEKESGKMFRMYNLHLDHIIENARVEGMECIWEQMQLNNKKRYLPSIVLGDFNAEEDDPSLAYCAQTGELFEVTEEVTYTFHDFGRGADDKPGKKIDYIFVTKEFLPEVKKVEAWKEELHGIYLSDHYPVAIELY